VTIDLQAIKSSSPVIGISREVSADREFLVVNPSDKDVKKLSEIADKLSLERGQPVLCLLYDVSPAVRSSQELFNLQVQYPNVMICDHHGVTSPQVEVRGKEVTGTQRLIEALSELLPILEAVPEGSKKLCILGVTDTMNLDPDSLICRYLIDTFCDPELRKQVWTKNNLEIIVEAARFGDITFFGGIDYTNLRYENLEPHEKIAYAIFSELLFEKAELVKEKYLEIAIERFNAHHIKKNYTLDSLHKKLDDILNDKEAQQGAPLPPYERIFRKNQMLQNFVFKELKREEVRSVFTGVKDDGTQEFNTKSIEGIFEKIGERLIANTEEGCIKTEVYEGTVRGYLRSLKTVNKWSSAFTRSEDKIEVTTCVDRLDYNLGKPQKRQEFFIFDWLREAAAAFKTSSVHVMDRSKTSGVTVISARAPKLGDINSDPYVNLSQPEVVGQLRALEAHYAELAGAKPAIFIVKPNLWLPIGSPLHIPIDVLTKFINENYNLLVCETDQYPYKNLTEPIMPKVTIGPGNTQPYSGHVNSINWLAKIYSAVFAGDEVLTLYTI
jgi:hypothetical protein